MAEIDIQEKQGGPIWPWILGILAVLVLVGVIWAVTRPGDDRDDMRTHPDTVPTTRDTIITGLDLGDGDIAEYVVFRDRQYA